MRIVVVLPAPLGPRNPKSAPSCTSIERSVMAWNWPKRLLRCSTSKLIEMTHSFLVIHSTHVIVWRTRFGWQLRLVERSAPSVFPFIRNPPFPVFLWERFPPRLFGVWLRYIAICYKRYNMQ